MSNQICEMELVSMRIEWNLYIAERFNVKGENLMTKIAFNQIFFSRYTVMLFQLRAV